MVHDLTGIGFPVYTRGMLIPDQAADEDPPGKPQPDNTNILQGQQLLARRRRWIHFYSLSLIAALMIIAAVGSDDAATNHIDPWQWVTVALVVIIAALFAIRLSEKTMKFEGYAWTTAWDALIASRVAIMELESRMQEIGKLRQELAALRRPHSN